MNSIEMMNYSNELHCRKKQKEEELKSIDSNLSKFQEECDHINVILGRDGFLPVYRNRCLLCGIKDYSFSKYTSVHAENYLTQYDIKDSQQRDEKFDAIQTMALGIMKDVPELEGEELVAYLNSFIQKSIVGQQSDELMLGLNKKSGF